MCPQGADQTHSGPPTLLSPATAISKSQLKDGQHQRVEHEAFRKSAYGLLYNESHAAKFWNVAQKLLNQREYPEYVPNHGIRAGHYETKPIEYWTCGFFPSCLYALLERRKKYPTSVPLPPAVSKDFDGQLLNLCRAWSKPLHQNAMRTDTHDVGFLMQPLRMDWELTSNSESLQIICKAAYNLSCRFDKRTGAIRSWNQAVSLSYNITDMDKNFLVIIDSMCNLDLLFYAGHYLGDTTLVEKAISHAHAVLRTLVRADYSTFHVVNLNPSDGSIKHQQTHQGYSDGSCWTRGQAWAILGFTQTYIWTRERVFLDTAISLSNYFIQRLIESLHEYPFVPPWDFDAPVNTARPLLRDASAGMIAANGLLLLHQALGGDSPYLETVYKIINDTLAHCLPGDSAKFSSVDESSNDITVSGVEWDSILMHSTVNNNEHALLRYSDHGLVYADYYFLELGNKLLRMGLM